MDENDLETGGKVLSEPAGSIFVAVSDGVVTLNGAVPSLTHKRLAGVLAWWVPEEVPAQEDNDDEVTDAVRLTLEKDPFVDATKIRVTSQDARWVGSQ